MITEVVSRQASRRWLSFVAGLVLVVGPFVPGSAAAALSTPDAAALPADGGVGSRPGSDAAVAFRAAFGLRDDCAYIQSVAANAVAVQDYGVPLVPTEQANLQQRFAVEAGVGSLNEAASADPSFGGLYIDQQAGGVIHVTTTGTTTEMAARIAKATSTGAQVQIDVVDYSLADLNASADAVVGDWSTWAKDGVTLASVGVDVVADEVDIAVADLTAAESASLQAAYGPKVEVTAGILAEPATCTSRSNCAPPDKGGLGMHATHGGLIYGCTSAFMGHPFGDPNNLYMLTAGHCIMDSGLGTAWYFDNNYLLGAASYSGYFSGSNADVGYTTATESQAKNLLYAYNNNIVTAINGELADVQQPLGTAVCFSGRTSGRTCGTVTQTDTTVNVGGVLIHHMWKGSFAAHRGDSGAPVTDTNATRAGGIISTTNGWYSPIDWFISQSGKVPCFNPTCTS